MSAAPTWATLAADIDREVDALPLAARPPQLPAADANAKLAVLSVILGRPDLSDKQARQIATAALADHGVYRVMLLVQRWAANMADVYAPGAVAEVDRATAETWVMAGDAIPADGRTAGHLERLGYLGITLTAHRRIGGRNLSAGETMWTQAAHARDLVARGLAVPAPTPDP